MKFLNKLERKFGRYAIHNLPMYIIALYVAGFVLSITGMTSLITLNPYLILHGQIWRIVTFVMVPPSTSIIFFIFTLMLYYTICQSLENAWGTFRFNLYYFTGVIATILASFLLYFITGYSYSMDTYYLNMSLFLAFAACFPDMQVMLYMIIPIKIRWLGYLDGILLLVSFFTGGLGTKVSIVVAMLNFLLFFFATRNYKKISPKDIHRRKVYKKEVRHSSNVTRHQCAVCHRTELDDPNLEFRFCSKCDGNYEYCQDHLFTHTHIKKH